MRTTRGRCVHARPKTIQIKSSPIKRPLLSLKSDYEYRYLYVIIILFFLISVNTFFQKISFSISIKKRRLICLRFLVALFYLTNKLKKDTQSLIQAEMRL